MENETIEIEQNEEIDPSLIDTCVICGHQTRIDKIELIGNNDEDDVEKKMKPGDLNICPNCHHVSMIDVDLKIVPVDEASMQIFKDTFPTLYDTVWDFHQKWLENHPEAAANNPTITNSPAP